MVAFVDIIGWPQGATITVDGKEIGKLPIYNRMFKWGKYRVEATKEGYEPEVREEFVVFKTDRRKTILMQLNKIGEKFGEV